MRIWGAVFLVVLVGALLAALQWTRSEALTELYAERLEALADEYGDLRSQYNDAVARAAITELVVRPDYRVEVVVRSGAHRLKTIETPFDARNELHVDYVVLDNRLFIRRLYDDQTPPQDGLLIDPRLEHLDWSDPKLKRGLTIYRGSLEPGRWVVTTSGNGALDLTRRDGPDDTGLVYAPPVQEFDQLREAIEERHRRVGLTDLLAAAWRRWTGSQPNAP
jgi:hypothetical protein